MSKLVKILKIAYNVIAFVVELFSGSLFETVKSVYAEIKRVWNKYFSKS